MAVFHVYALALVLLQEMMMRVGLFFVLNGAGLVAAIAVWGRKTGWGRTGATWGFEVGLAGWVVRGVGFQMGWGGSLKGGGLVGLGVCRAGGSGMG